MDKPNIYVTRALLPEALALLRTRCHVEVGPQGGLSGEELLDAVRGRHGIVAPYLPLDADVIDALSPTCIIIACYGVGYDHVALDAASRRGIWVTNNPGNVTEDTADLAFALLLGTARRLRGGDIFVRGEPCPWGPTVNTGARVNGKTLGLVGSGRIAQAVARRAAGFGMRLLYTARRRNPELEAATGACFACREDLLAQADFVSLHVPLTAETHHYIGKKELDAMQPHAILINTARGAVVDEAALIRALESGGIAAAGLDVFEHEPVVPEALRRLPNVLLTPHNGTGTLEARVDMGESCARKIFAALDGQLPPDCLNPGVRAGR